MDNPLIISIEHAIRFFQTEVVTNVFLNIEVGFKSVINNKYRFEVYQTINSSSQLILHKNVSFLDQSAVFLDSHEDPLIAHGDYTYLSIAVERKLLNDSDLFIKIFENESLVFERFFKEIPYSSLYQQLNTQLVDLYEIKTLKNTSLTLHLNDNKANYKEINLQLKAGETINFYQYLKDFSYIGVQFSFEELIPEVEEKYIIKGQKGICESSFLHVDEKIIQSNLPFRQEYVNHIYKNSNPDIFKEFHEVKNINELITYYQANPINYFESNFHFLIEHYRNNLTYSQDNLYSLTELKNKIHTDNRVCSQCSKKQICLQVVPSGLSYSLWRENIALDDNEQKKCRIYSLLDE